jgi:hypothetical protein
MTPYTQIYDELKAAFLHTGDSGNINGSTITIHNVKFESTIDNKFFSSDNDVNIYENSHFSYPVFVPEDKSSKRVILLFHGLNERSWDKYLTWAYYLAKESGSYIVLFPISFHINRSPQTWRDPRSVFKSFNIRKVDKGEIDKSSLANVVLSNRLSETPLRFFSSGYQTVRDVCKLVESIQDGTHPFLPRTRNVDIFAYSIGAFMSQIIMMGNPGGLFDNSRLFMFCGGSVFSYMKGTSRYIMDKIAYDTVFSYFVTDFEKTIRRGCGLYDFFNSDNLGLSFRSMLSLSRKKEFRDNAMKRFQDKVYAITLAKDIVIPPTGIVKTLTGAGVNNEMIKVMDFPYEYSHEAPFPVLKNDAHFLVDDAFKTVFGEAVSFFGK